MKKNKQITKMSKLARLILFITTLLPFVLKSQNFTPDMDKYQTDPKSQYIKNNDYLSKSSMVYTETYHADSLRGFNESWVKSELLSKGVYGSEYINFLPRVKREFIDRKYKIGLYSELPKVVTNTSGISSRPPGGGGSVINLAPCVNEDFESTTPAQYTSGNAVTGWTVESGQNTSVVYPQLGNTSYGAGCNANAIPSWNAGSPEFWIVQTPIFGVAAIGTLPNSPLGGTRVVQMNNTSPTGLMTRIRSTFPVTAANTLFQFAYAGSWDGVHDCCGQPAFRIDMYQQPCAGGTPSLLTCSNVSLTPSGPSCSSGVSGYSMTGTVSWTNWVVRFIDLTPYIGSCVTVQITNADCSYSGHYGQAFFDARCGGQLIGTSLGLGGISGFVPGPVSFCAGSNQAVIAAPLGYSTYSWVAPITSSPIPASQATLSTLTISNPVPNSVYTVYLQGSSGCQYTSTNAIVFTSVNIAAIGSGSTCPGGSSGSATVQGTGSGSGYNWTWINAANNLTVGTGSTTGIYGTVNGLAPGVYSVVLTGLGASGCGSAVATTTVVQGQPGIINVLKPYCGNEAYLSVTGGSNFQWYNGNTAITGSLGTAMNYTVVNPVNQSIWWLSYLSQFGCQDSVKFTLVASSPGLLGTPLVSWICPGGSNGTAVISLTPAAGAPPGINSWSVYSTGNTPAYSSSVYPTGSNQYTATNLSQGTYSVRAFDGSCKYGTNFTVNSFTYAFNVNPITATLCPGSSIAANITFTPAPSISQYSYSWTPNVWLAGNANTYSSSIITPVVPVGTNSLVTYTIVVTPSLVNCPTSKTMAILGVNPPIPTITAIPNMCNTSGPYQINTNPTNGTFSSGVTGTSNPISQIGGIITPSLANIGVNSFTYGINVFQCLASNTSTYQVSQFQTAALTSSVPPLCVTNAPFNLMNIVQSSAGGTWTASNGGLTSSGPGTFSFNPTGLLTQIYPITYTTSSIPNPTVCPHSSQLFVSVTKTITPIITSIPEFCTNSVVRQMTVTPSGGSWYNNSSISNSGLLSPTLAAVPSSVAFYSIQIGPCVNTSTSTLLTSSFNPAGFSGTISNLCVTSPVFNLMSIVQSGVGNWLTNVQGVVSNSLNPSVYVNTPSVTPILRVLTYAVPSTPNANLCPDSKTITVSIYNPPSPSIANVGPYCNNASPVQMTVTPTIGYWSSSSYLSNTGVFSPSLCSIGNNAVQYVIGTNTCNSQQTKFVGIEAFVSAKITSNLPDQCNNGQVVNLSPFTNSGIGNWSGPGINGNSFNPALTGSGTFSLLHQTSSLPSGMCPDQDMISVNVYSLAIPILTKIGPYCNNALPVQIQVSPVGGLFSGPGMGAVSLGGKFNPANALIGDNLINYSITSGPCVAYAQMTVNVERFVSAAFQKSVSPICLIPEKTTPINLDGYVVNPGGIWEINGIDNGTSMFDPLNAKIGKNNKIVYYTHSIPTFNLCPDRQQINVEVRYIPKVMAVSETTSGCAPIEIVFNTPSVIDGEGTWNFDDGTEKQIGLTVSHVYTTSGTYNVTFSYKDEIGCEAIPAKANPVKIFTGPKADFSFPEEILISNPQIQLDNQTTILGDNTYQWSFSNMPTSEDVNPFVTFPAIGKYQVILLATSPLAAGGCTDQVVKTIEVKNDFYIYVPNAFSPNFDNLNDVFKPEISEYGIDVKIFEMEIFDRWGHNLFRTTDYKKGWNGKNKNGEILKEEVYIYRIKYKDMDGNSYDKMGHVTLLK